jgi:phage terminase large subunit-like protein
VLDELHAHKTRGLFDVVKSGRGARKNRLLWIITTAGFNLHGVCYEQRTYLTKVLNGIFEADHYFGIIFSLDEKDDCFDEKVWPKANPMIGITPTWESMREEAADARASPDSLGNFKTKNCNIWLGAASGWISPEAWKACKSKKPLDWDAFDGLECFIGADLADKDDICALALIAYDVTGQLLIKPKFYLPELVLASPTHSQGSGPAPYRTWAENGTITITPGDWVDHEEVEKQIREWRERFFVKKAVFDQFAGAQTMISRLNKDGDADDPFAFSLPKKAINVTDPAKEFASRVKAGPSRLLHDGNECMSWMVSNVVVAKRTDETILPKKEKENSPNKIDGVDAVINALKPSTMPPPTKKNPYNDRELRVL